MLLGMSSTKAVICRQLISSSLMWTGMKLVCERIIFTRQLLDVIIGPNDHPVCLPDLPVNIIEADAYDHTSYRCCNGCQT